MQNLFSHSNISSISIVGMSAKLKRQFIGKNEAHQVCRIEDMNIGTTYSITISPPDDELEDELMDFEMYDKQIYKFVDRWRKKVWGTQQGFILKLYLDMTTHTQRLHWHGTIHIINLRYTLYWLKRISPYCIYEIDTISDPKIWLEYCKKSDKIFSDIGFKYNLSNVVKMKN